MVDEPELTIRRPFEWGIVLIADSEHGGELPELQRGHPCAAGPSVLIVVVRHAQDTDADLAALDPNDVVPSFEVTVRCWKARPPLESPTFLTELDLSSGSVEIGDADRWDALILAPGRWKVSVKAEPADHPEVVDLWFQRERA